MALLCGEMSINLCPKTDVFAKLDPSGQRCDVSVAPCVAYERLSQEKRFSVRTRLPDVEIDEKKPYLGDTTRKIRLF